MVANLPWSIKNMNTDTLLEPPMAGVNDPITIQFPYGLLGFERVKNYILLANRQEEPFMWLRMVDATRKAFLIVSPFLAIPDYQPDIPESDAEYLGLQQPADALVFNICTLRGPGRATINLKGPLVVNRHTMIGKQVIPDNAVRYALNHPLPVS
jgi:flagellar assembly factor FliW